MNVLRLLQSVHGHLGVLAAVALLHPAVLLRRGLPMSARTRLSVLLTVVGAVGAFLTGVFIYGDYRNELKRHIFVEAPKAGMLFETKEHLGFIVATMACGAGVCALLAPRNRADLRQLAAVLFGIAAVLCFVTAGLGGYVASVRDF